MGADGTTHLPSQPLARPFRAVVGIEPFDVPPPDNLTGGVTRTYGLFGDLDGDGIPELILSIDSTPEAHADTYSIDPSTHVATRIRREPMRPIMAIADLDEDGHQDLLEQGGVAWGTGTGRFTPLQRWPNYTQVSPRPLVLDLDGDGHLDVVSARPCSAGGDQRVLTVIGHRGARVLADQSSLMPPGHLDTQSLWEGHLGGEHLIAAFGWSCDGDTHDRVPIFFREAGGRWEGFQPTDAPYSEHSPMGGVDLPVGDETWLLFSAHASPKVADQSTNYRALRRSGGGWTEATLPFRFFSPRPDDSSYDGPAMIPWDIAKIDLDGDGLLDLVIPHGADNPFSDEIDTIGPQTTLALRNLGDGEWARFSSTGDLEQPGKPHFGWRRETHATIGGRLILVIGGVGQAPSVLEQP